MHRNLDKKCRSRIPSQGKEGRSKSNIECGTGSCKQRASFLVNAYCTWEQRKFTDQLFPVLHMRIQKFNLSAVSHLHNVGIGLYTSNHAEESADQLMPFYEHVHMRIQEFTCQLLLFCVT